MQRGGNRFFLILFVALVGAIVGNVVGQVGARTWPVLGQAVPMGLPQPVTLDLGVMSVTFGISIRLSLAGAAGLVAALALMLRRA